jgi:uncharacterized protein
MLRTPADRRTEQAQDQADPRRWPWFGGSASKLALALFFGLIFGFLLQKGGVAKFDILIGVLLLENFVVVQVMLAAIIVGMLGAYLLEKAGVLEPHIKETVYGSNILGGLMFGVGFGLIAYCLGMVAGSYLFALASRFTGGTITKWGQRGKITLADLAGVSRGKLILFAVPALVGVLVVLEWLS